MPRLPCRQKWYVPYVASATQATDAPPPHGRVVRIEQMHHAWDSVKIISYSDIAVYS